MVNRRTFLKTGSAAALLAGCSRGPKKSTLALNWKPDPQFGGFYAADFGPHQISVEILPGGAGTPAIQMVGAGSATFGIAAADDVVLARSRGNDVVAVYAVFQNNPQGIMVHASRHLNAIGDVVKEGTLAMQRGLPYARILERKFGLDKVQVVPSPGGDVAVFLHDPLFAQQCYVMSEPLVAKAKGGDVQVFPVSDLGYNPYHGVLVTSGDLLRKEESMVRHMVEAVRQGWRFYLDDPKEANERMHLGNPSMDIASFEAVAEAQKPFVETEGTRRDGLGSMRKDRWEELCRQLVELGDIPKAPPVEECYREM